MGLIRQFFAALAFLAVGVSVASCATVGPMNDANDHRFGHNSLFIDQPSGPPKAVVLMLHGLNLKPAKMDGWAQLLSAHGAMVMRFALYGHSGEAGHMGKASAAMWRDQFKEALTKAQGRAQELQVPLYFVGFSLGALVGLEWLATNPQSQKSFARMVLIAPAIATPWYSQAAAGLLSMFSQSLTLPSRSPKQYRANKGTSVAAYQALFALKKSLEDAKFKNNNVPALVLIDKHDELVPSASIKKIITEHRLGQWQLNIVDNRFAQDNYGFRHLMVDEESVGPVLWADLSQQVLNFFKI